MASIPGVGGAQGESSGATEQAREKAGELAGQASEQAKQAKAMASDRLLEQLDQRSAQAAEQVTGQASDIRTVAEQLREQGKDKPAQLAEQAAERVERVGSYLRDRDADTMLGDIEDFARQRPWAVIAGGMALGFAASRFLKASSTDRYYGRTPRQLPNTTTAAPRTGSPMRPAGDGMGGMGETAVGGPPPSTGAL